MNIDEAIEIIKKSNDGLSVNKPLLIEAQSAILLRLVYLQSKIVLLEAEIETRTR